MEQQTVAHTRLHLANERTLLSWTKLSCVLAAGGFLTRVLVPSPRAFISTTKAAQHHVEIVQGAQLVLALVVLALGLRLFFRRRAFLGFKWIGNYSTRLSPMAAIVGVLVTLIVTLFQALAHEAEYYSPDCLRLKLPIDDFAAPPYLYISFHGSADPLGGLCTGVGAVHRFSLTTGAYVGPAADQRAALVHAPRMMAMHNELLVLADAGVGSEFHRPALAIFGDCAAKGPRPFLGRVRATDAETEARFMHPYGVATGKDGSLRVSAQNGGALLDVNLMSTSHPITVVAELEPLPGGGGGEAELAAPPASARPPPPPFWSNAKDDGVDAKSGPLRGLAIDDDGCNHVADKHANKIWHVCPNDKLRSTHVINPIGVHAHSRLLYVGSFAGTGASAVYVLERSASSKNDDADAYHIRQTIQHKRLVHPAGLVVQSGTLYVLDQLHRSLLTFELPTGNFSGALIENLPDAPEGLLLSSGC